MNNWIEIIKQFDIPTRAKILCDLNKWNWPVELSKYWPEDAQDGIESNWTNQQFQEAFDAALELTPNKEFSREWNKDSMTGERFEAWYRATYEWREVECPERLLVEYGCEIVMNNSHDFSLFYGGEEVRRDEFLHELFRYIDQEFKI